MTIVILNVNVIRRNCRESKICERKLKNFEVNGYATEK